MNKKKPLTRVTGLSKFGNITPITALATVALLFSSHPAQASTWTGGNGNWSSDLSPGWNGTGVPNAVGAVATKSDATSANITQDIVAGVTVGTFSLTGSASTFQVLAGSNGITFDQDGAGAGTATILNSGSAATARINFAALPLTLGDDLLINNTSSSTNTSGSISFGSGFSGSHNLTIRNATNATGSGDIVFSAAGTLVGNVLIEKGAVRSVGFGTAATNVVTLGSAGNGSATWIDQATNTTVNNNIVAAASTGGTLVLGANSAAASDVTFAGTVTLNGDLTLTSAKTGANAVIYTKVISGVGALTTTGGVTRLTGNNTFTGDTRVTSGTLQLGAASGTTTLALQNSTLDMNTADAGAVSFGTSTSTTITNATFAGIKGTRDLSLLNSNTTPAAVALTIGNNTTNQSYSGILSGTGASLTKVGTNTQTLSGANTYTGATIISNGTLRVDGSLASGSAVSVAAGATLRGTGTIGGATSVAGTGTVAAGINASTIGTLTFSSSLTAVSGATFSLKLNGTAGTFDLLTSSGVVTLGSSTLSFLEIGSGSWTGTTSAFSIVHGSSIVGTFAGLSNGAAITIGANVFTLNYGASDVTLTAIPEPSTYAALVGVLVLGGAVLRRAVSVL